MKVKNLLLSGIFLGLTGMLMAQSPQRFNYQAVARDGSGNVIASSPVGINIQIHQTTPTGTVVYAETHAPTTTNIGLMNLQIGGGTVTSGTFNTIDWGAGPYYVEIGMDPTGGTSYTNMGTQQLLSVPYALYAENSGTPGPAGPTGPAGPAGADGANGTNGTNGTNGINGVSVNWLGTLASAPGSPSLNDGYYNSVDGISYIWDGSAWQIIAQDGADGATGSVGPQGIQGDPGPQGIQGDPGPQGIQGDPGPQGIQGNPGPVGATGAAGPIGPAGPIGGANTQIIYNNSGVAAGSANLTWNSGTNTLGITGTTVTTSAQVTSLGGGGTRFVQTDNAGTLSAVAFTGITGSGTINYHPKFTAANTIGNSLIQDNGTSLAINTTPITQYMFYFYKQQLTANGDGQNSTMGYRTRDSQNDGTAYGVGTTNNGAGGYSFWGDLYTFGVAGFNYNDYTRCGGTLGAEQSGGYWGSLGYKTSASVGFGVYGSNAFGSGGGYLPNTAMTGAGGGFFGNVVGSISKGKVAGQFNSGELFAQYNIGDVYVSGRQIEMVATGEQKVPAYTVTSTQVTVYNKGKIQLENGAAYVSFDASYTSLLGDAPVVTVTPMGACNGVYISRVDKNGFYIQELNSGSSNVEVSWISVGDRVDAATMNSIPEVLKSNEFDVNLQNAMFDDSNKEGAGLGFWWDGATLRFGKVPAELNPKAKSENATNNK